MNWEPPFFIFATIVNIVAATWILGAVFTDRFQRLPKWHVIGLMTGGAGLVWQALRNIQFLVTGESATDADLPLWFLKDLGYAMIAFYSIYLVAKGHLVLNLTRPVVPDDEPVKVKPAAKKTVAKKPAAKSAKVK